MVRRAEKFEFDFDLTTYFLSCLQVGDKVVALPEYRAWAELVAVPAKYVYALPDNMTPLEAVAITMNYLVAYILVFDMANIAPGKSLLLHSAGGGVVRIKILLHTFNIDFAVPRINEAYSETQMTRA